MPGETPKNKDLTVLLRISDLVQSPFQSRFEQVLVANNTTRTYIKKEKEKANTDELYKLAHSI